MRQASRRSWRIGQKHPVRVKFLTYQGTMQETCVRLMGKKLLVALMMEGKFSGEGLQSLDTDEDVMSAMARELVERAGVGESADAVWQDLRRERSLHLPVIDRELPAEPEPSVLTGVPALVATGIQQELPTLFLAQPSQNTKQKRSSAWPTAEEAGSQMLLFA